MDLAFSRRGWVGVRDRLDGETLHEDCDPKELIAEYEKLHEGLKARVKSLRFWIEDVVLPTNQERDLVELEAAEAVEQGRQQQDWSHLGGK